jgi:hypothetical protein
MTINLIKEYINNILSEGRYDAVVTEASRDIINAFKAGKNKIVLEYELPYKNGYTDVDIVVIFKKVKGNQFDPKYRFDIDAEISYPEPNRPKHIIEILIEYEPENFNQKLSVLIEELKETLRHEIEHVAQNLYDRPSDIKHSLYYNDYNHKDIPTYDYLLMPEEIPAFVQGLYKKAKMKKMPLDLVIDEYLNSLNYYGKELSKTQINKIRKIWITWAKNNIRTAQFSK